MSDPTLFTNGNGNAAAPAAGAGTVPAPGAPLTEAPVAQAQRPAGAAPKLGELTDGQAFEGIFAVKNRELRQTKKGTDFLKLLLADSTGAVAAIDWDGTAEWYEAAAQGSVVVVSGRFSCHAQYGDQIKITALRAARPDEYDPAELIEAPPVPVERLEADMRELIATVQEPSLGRLLESVFGADTRTWEHFRRAPAAKYYHQAYPGGLLEHALSVAQAVSAASAFFPGINRDVAVTGALLHDIGKLEAYNDDPMAIDMTDAGRLQGEIPLGYYRIRREIEGIDGFDPELAQAILHIILSHHGSLEHGSPVVPCTREATLVHHADNLGGKLGSFDRIERELGEGERWSRFDRGIDAAAYFGDDEAA